MDRRLRVSLPTAGPAPALSAMGAPPTYQQQQPQQVPAPSSTPTTASTKNSTEPTVNETKTGDKTEEDSSDDDDAWLEEFDNDDQALQAFRERRLAELQAAHHAQQQQQQQQPAAGHGEVRTIAQDEFLPECTGNDSNPYVVVHFFHDDFERCKLMDHHLNILAPLHVSCKFVRINAEKAPFFVAKLAIQTLPTLLVFKDGKTVERLMGFEGLSDSKHPDEFPTSRLGRWLEKTGAIGDYNGPDSDEEDDGADVTNSRNHIRVGMLSGRHRAYDEDV